MAAESVKIEVIGISTETGGDDQDRLSIVESKPQEFELVAEENREPARVVLKDVEVESSEEESSGAQDDVVTGGAEQRSQHEDASSETLPASDEIEEEEEDCGFCLFMKAGPCGERFSIWQNCVDKAEKAGEDIVEKCAQTTSLLKVCMEMNLDYYSPVIDAERAMQEIAAQEGNQAAGKTADQETSAEEVAPQDVDKSTDAAQESKDTTEKGNTEKVVEVVAVASVDGEVTEVVTVVAEATVENRSEVENVQENDSEQWQLAFFRLEVVALLAALRTRSD
ncbi:hypothetical protein R1sor_019140 [Riccia sorocarpa]|uniref:GCK domain-containing protein n=1 Tax=Riccia sorocarpa TaxID=122646 RepID=A0ABD3IBS4_9MARC